MASYGSGLGLDRRDRGFSFLARYEMVVLDASRS